MRESLAMSPAPRIGFGFGRCLAAILVLAVAETAQAAPPTADFYPHKSYQRKEYGWGATSYWLYEPADPKPDKRPSWCLITAGSA